MLPNLIVIGAMKCGTSSLHHYLNLHPQISMSEPRELAFFVEEKNWSRGTSWYASHWPNATQIRGETSPHYTHFPIYKGVAQKMHQIIPDAKIIYLVRDPIERIVSHYLHFEKRKKERTAIAKVLASNIEDNAYINCSKYYMQIQQYLDYYDRKSIFVVSSEKLRKRPSDTMRELFDFLVIDDSFFREDFQKRLNKTADKRKVNRLGLFVERLRRDRNFTKFRFPKFLRQLYKQLSTYKLTQPTLTPEMKSWIVEILQPDIDKFRQFCGCEFEEWGL